ncbi:uncharacterized protein LOC103710635 isoform X2 [Phoenix dactylifera]|uniref:Uncharacterized protein LOC103710635 isoform X2 n=1 Tax=Phoenix dactylifera TaxID=42345 RepID=A0A8B8J728_PHODC|nr:uncharacterized protein LOC103710635 isoform X2 [Phoenix dactylifera]
MATEDRRKEAEAEVVYKTKVIQFLGRSTPIILQNDNGPCPLLAICNVLLLRNNLNLSLDASEVSLQKLLSLVAEKLIDSNSNVQDKDDVYVSNQQQNIADAIDLLPRLATGIDVNVHFRKINDFEFTRECAIFDLLDIGLYHGWIVDPQDTDTAAAIGSKSYNTLVGELVAFEARKSEGENKSVQEEDSIDFAAATTATLGVPSPCLSRGRSFDDHPISTSVDQRRGKGDMEEEEELMRALNLSRSEMSTPVNVSMSPVADWSNPSPKLEESTHQCSGLGTHADSLGVQNGAESEKLYQSDSFAPQVSNSSSDWKDDVTAEDGSTRAGSGYNTGQSISEGSTKLLISSDSKETVRTDMLMQKVDPPLLSTEEDGSDWCCTNKDLMIASGEDQSARHDKPTDNLIDCNSAVFSDPIAHCSDFLSSNGREELSDVSEAVSSSFEGSEPIYEGEERILESVLMTHENQEPVYEGEAILAEQADKTEEDNSPKHLNDEVTRHQWQLIKNFLENNASQLTIYGLFCLQEGLKERELCVFFRNNHFSSMFKFNGELYLLATDQGYINQPDLVWEKLNEVNGDTVFMTGNFMEFKAENQVNDSWNEQNAMTSTADYLASLESSSPSSSTINSDLQLAIALQQQEFEQQPPCQQQQHPQQPPVTVRPRLVTGPQLKTPCPNDVLDPEDEWFLHNILNHIMETMLFI